MIKFLMLLFFVTAWSGICSGSTVKANLFVMDTIPSKQNEGRGQQQKEQPTPSGKGIKSVPKAKNQAKPKAISVKPVKMKPVKIIRPRITGKGLGK